MLGDQRESVVTRTFHDLHCVWGGTQRLQLKAGVRLEPQAVVLTRHTEDRCKAKAFGIGDLQHGKERHIPRGQSDASSDICPLSFRQDIHDICANACAHSADPLMINTCISEQEVHCGLNIHRPRSGVHDHVEQVPIIGVAQTMSAHIQREGRKAQFMEIVQIGIPLVQIHGELMDQQDHRIGTRPFREP
jgi:hypothetical protein